MTRASIQHQCTTQLGQQSDTLTRSLWVLFHTHLVNLTDLGCNKLGLVDDSVCPLQLHQLALWRGSHLDAVSALKTQSGRHQPANTDKAQELKQCVKKLEEVAT